MDTEPKKRVSGCPVAYGLDSFGDRWSLLIIRDLMVHGKKTYSEFLGSDEGIATNILINRLKTLEADGILSKSRDPDNRRSFTYALTPKGKDLAPIVIEIIRWSGKHDDRPSALKPAVRAVEEDPDGFEKRLRGACD
ncbi:helix-turn-helix transcriptional regulator [Roseobacter sp. YSTF-M11]|uniref:Helix-turn-helix transcriptional regulator n=1 Tax=Roseobacter insulae TaxID=2859783 RepID=A0A9X1FZ39_9RHOB|nr:helix-turn-helix domain-containing protein [Roseobacter insulae]MBW4710331.1 helix-turn-helix transcriptional regulator [Roseobacter insulae]